MKVFTEIKTIRKPNDLIMAWIETSDEKYGIIKQHRLKDIKLFSTDWNIALQDWRLEHLFETMTYIRVPNMMDAIMIITRLECVVHEINKTVEILLTQSKPSLALQSF